MLFRSSIHPCICPSLCSSSHPSIYLAIHEFIWTWTFLAIFRSSDPCVHRSFHLPVYCSIYVPSTACTVSTSQLPSVVGDRQFLTRLTSECASRHNGVHFFDIWTSTSGPDLVCFVHFNLEMCFAPGCGVHLFGISTSKSGPRPPVFYTFDLEM